MEEIVLITTGTIPNQNNKIALNKNSIPYLKKGDFVNFHLVDPIFDLIEVERVQKNFYLSPRSKILISKHNFDLEKLSVAYHEGRLAFGPDIIGVTVLRPGLLTKYVLALLTNGMIFRTFLLLNKTISEETKSITIADLAQIPVPIIPVKQQRIFENLVDYVLYSDKISKQSLYFEQLLETLIAELFFPAKFKHQGIELAIKLTDLPPLIDLSPEDREDRIYQTHRQLSDPSHPISAELINFVASGSTISGS